MTANLTASISGQTQELHGARHGRFLILSKGANVIAVDDVAARQLLEWLAGEVSGVLLQEICLAMNEHKQAVDRDDAGEDKFDERREAVNAWLWGQLIKLHTTWRNRCHSAGKLSGDCVFDEAPGVKSVVTEHRPGTPEYKAEASEQLRRLAEAAGLSPEPYLKSWADELVEGHDRHGDHRDDAAPYHAASPTWTVTEHRPKCRHCGESERKHFGDAKWCLSGERRQQDEIGTIHRCFEPVIAEVEKVESATPAGDPQHSGISIAYIRAALRGMLKDAESESPRQHVGFSQGVMFAIAKLTEQLPIGVVDLSVDNDAAVGLSDLNPILNDAALADLRQQLTNKGAECAILGKKADELQRCYDHQENEWQRAVDNVQAEADRLRAENERLTDECEELQGQVATFEKARQMGQSESVADAIVADLLGSYDVLSIVRMVKRVVEKLKAGEVAGHSQKWIKGYMVGYEDALNDATKGLMSELGLRDVDRKLSAADGIESWIAKNAVPRDTPHNLGGPNDPLPPFKCMTAKYEPVSEAELIAKMERVKGATVSNDELLHGRYVMGVDVASADADQSTMAVYDRVESKFVDPSTTRSTGRIGIVDGIVKQAEHDAWTGDDLKRKQAAEAVQPDSDRCDETLQVEAEPKVQGMSMFTTDENQFDDTTDERLSELRLNHERKLRKINAVQMKRQAAKGVGIINRDASRNTSLGDSRKPNA